MRKDKEQTLFKPSELVIITAGFLFLLNVLVMGFAGSVLLWFATVLIYAVGVILFILDK